MNNINELAETPFTDQLISNKNLNLVSVHALPINHSRSLKESTLLSKYQQVFGNEYLSSEVTYTGNIMDNPIKPELVLKRSEEITAKAFGAQKTFYITMGTTLSSYIAVFGLTNKYERVLVDKNCHQSIHFALQRNHNKITYSENKETFKSSGRVIMDVEDFLIKYEQAYKKGKPYKLVILNGCSYEGVIYDVKKIIEACIQINDNVHFLIDEAWTAYGYFHPFYKKYTAMHTANELKEKYPNKNISIICTQSAHKSLSSLRQGSYIHVNSNNKTIQDISMSKYMLHTTSPSYPIIASLELARAQMVLEGYDLIEEKLKISAKLKQHLNKYKNININNDIKNDEWCFLDPSKISINFSNKKIPTNYIKELLIKNNIYINRKTDNSILFNIHIGIKHNEYLTIIQSLNEIENSSFHWMINSKRKKIHYEPLMPQENADYYLISYPPGIPIVVPGDRVDAKTCQNAHELQLSGATLIKSIIN
ncbi:aminotransferase class I/II-fold pyridoxal phosphate-dependent enzyme [Bacillus pseudomycoides]|uniref:aminotransferase class I/II-fold pyridoxal phosphate-dependent enzyme n=1 Tax=Bacillus pseudomycoides TaxID=64104 RepID=UPI0015D50F03|nr:aminotransferase class I/II-fold pyridoxal phosphate-dependent enzyme [Bacillus pseudomycoides]